MSLNERVLKSASREVLADRVYQLILGQLMDGGLPAGTSISIDGMARVLDVSATPVREAMARLEATGLVVRAALRGYRVAPLLSPDEIVQLMDARCAIEVENASLACGQASNELCDLLEIAIADMRNAPHGSSFEDFSAYWEADERFHLHIAEHANNRFLLAAYNALGGQLQRFRYFSGVGVTDADAAIAEHAAIREAFVRRDRKLAARQMKAHIVRAMSRTIKAPAAASEGAGQPFPASAPNSAT